MSAGRDPRVTDGLHRVGMARLVLRCLVLAVMVAGMVGTVVVFGACAGGGSR